MCELCAGDQRERVSIYVCIHRGVCSTMRTRSLLLTTIQQSDYSGDCHILPISCHISRSIKNWQTELDDYDDRQDGSLYSGPAGSDPGTQPVASSCQRLSQRYAVHVFSTHLVIVVIQVLL